MEVKRSVHVQTNEATKTSMSMPPFVSRKALRLTQSHLDMLVFKDSAEAKLSNEFQKLAGTFFNLLVRKTSK